MSVRTNSSSNLESSWLEKKRSSLSIVKSIKVPSSQFRTDLRRKVQRKEIGSIQDLLKYKIKEPEIVDEFFNNELKELVLCSDLVGHMKAKGKVPLHRVIVGVGNQKGLIGLGSSKSLSYSVAVKKATQNAKCNLVYLKTSSSQEETYHGPHTTTSQKRGATRVTIRPLTGNSVTASDRGKMYCDLGGLVNILIQTGNKGRVRHGKVRSFYNYFYALHECLKKQNELK